MAITFLTGIMGTGKSYYAMYRLYHSFIYVPKKTKYSFILDKFLSSKDIKKYDFAYTNINQFDYSLSPQIKPFDYDEFQVKLVELHKMYLNKATDDTLISYAKTFKIYNCLFVIDEAQNFFDKENAVSTWWFTYHRHLHQDIFLITQDLDLLHTSYKKLGEFFYKAVASSSRIFKNKFRYVQYNSYKLAQKDKIGDFHLPIIQDIFKMYVSGDKAKIKSVVKKYLAYALVLSALLVYMFSSFISQYNTTSNDTNQTSVTVQHENNVTVQDKKTPSKLTQKLENNETMLFDIRCVDMLCTYEKTDFPKPLLNKILNKTTPDFVWFFNNGTYIQYFVMLPADTFKFLKIGEKENEKKSKKEGNNNPIAKLTSK